MERFIGWELGYIRAVQALAPGLDVPMRVISGLGQEGFFILFLPLLYWCVDRRLGARVAFLLLVNNLLNGWVKWILHQPRPYWLVPSLGHAAETSYGVPSGHAQNGAALWFYLASLLRRRWAWVAAAAIVLLVSFSRVYLGVHFPRDILAGWALGLLCLWGFLRYSSQAEQWLSERTDAALIGLSVVVAAVVLAITAAILLALRGVPDPAAWAGYAAGARDPHGAVTVAGTLAGALLGFGLEEHHLRFDAGGPAGKRVLRFLLGLAGFVAILFGPKLLLPVPSGLPEEALRFFRYFLSALWATYGAPWLFVSWRLAAGRPAMPSR